MPRTRLSLALVVILIGLAPAARAQVGNGYDLHWNTIDAAGGQASGSGYALFGTAGQPDAGSLTAGTYALRGGFVLARGATVGVPEPGTLTPTRFHLRAPQPNPFVTSTAFAIELPAERTVRIRLYDVAGHLVRTLMDRACPAGQLEVRWDGRSDAGREVPAGLYFGRVTAGEFFATFRTVSLSHGGAR